MYALTCSSKYVWDYLPHMPGSFFETLYCQISINGPEHIAD